MSSANDTCLTNSCLLPSKMFLLKNKMQTIFVEYLSGAFSLCWHWWVRNWLSNEAVWHINLLYIWQSKTHTYDDPNFIVFFKQTTWHSTTYNLQLQEIILARRGQGSKCQKKYIYITYTKGHWKRMDSAFRTIPYWMLRMILHSLMECQLLCKAMGNVMKENYQCHAMNTAFQTQYLWYTDTYTQQFHAMCQSRDYNVKESKSRGLWLKPLPFVRYKEDTMNQYRTMYMK
jgi:hypothetical protein